MPFSYCYECDGEISDWKEEYLGCKHCDYGESEDAGTATNTQVIKRLIEEMEELKDEVKNLSRGGKCTWLMDI